jgi:hypothetical protein
MGRRDGLVSAPSPNQGKTGEIQAQMAWICLVLSPNSDFSTGYGESKLNFSGSRLARPKAYCFGRRASKTVAQILIFGKNVVGLFWECRPASAGTAAALNRFAPEARGSGKVRSGVAPST